MPVVHRRAVLAGLGLAAQGFAVGRAFGEARRHAALQAFLDDYVAKKRLPGGVVAIRRGKGPAQFVSAGTLAFDTDAKAGPDSLFRVYSMTKPITGIATMMLIEDGKLRLDQPLADILPAFKDPKVMLDGDVTKTRPAAGPILIRHLLTHTAGLSYHLFGERPLAKLYRQQGLFAGIRNPTLEPTGLPAAANLDEMGARMAPLPLDFDPGTKWQYSMAADLLGLVIQTVSGVSFWDFLRTRLFAPLRMADTDFVVPPGKLDRLTTAYFRVKETGLLVPADDRKSSPFAKGREIQSGGGGLVSTAADYIRFNAMLLNGGVLDGRRILKPQTVALARSNLMPPGVTAGITGVPTGFGALMQVMLPGTTGPGGEPAGSYGWSGAAGTTMWIDPANDLTVALMVQYFPSGVYPTYVEVRRAAYQDLKGA